MATPTYDISAVTIPGPAIVTYNSATYYSVGDITQTVKKTYVDRKSAMFGTLKKVLTDMTIEISFSPANFTAALAAKMFPYASTLPSARLIGATDMPLVVHSISGLQRTYARAALTKMPSLNCSVSADSLLDGITFTAVSKNGVLNSTAASLYTDATVAFDDTGFDTTKMITGPFDLEWGTSPWDSMPTQEGIKVNFNMDIKPFPGGENGTKDFLLLGIDAEATFKPVGVTAAEFDAKLDLQGTATSGIGASTTGVSLVITAADFKLTLNNTIAMEGGSKFGVDDQYNGDIKAVSQRSVTTGALNPLWEITANA